MSTDDDKDEAPREDVEDEAPRDEAASPDEAPGGEAAASAAPEEPKENRKERRKKRRAERSGQPLDEPRDRNARVRERAKKRQEEVRRDEPQGLTAGELVDDAFARGVHGLGKWAQSNAGVLALLVGVSVLGGVGWLVHLVWSGSKAEAATELLVTAVTADKAQIDPDGKKPANDDPDPTYKSREARATAALAAYARVTEREKGTGAAILARLGAAGALLDLERWDDAAAAYREVRVSTLAAADADVRCRALEGQGFAAEGKGQAAEAAQFFKELESQGVRGFVDLGRYHQARLLAAKGDVEGAKALIKKARESVQKAEVRAGTQYLMEALSDLERKVDPSAAPPKILGGADRQMSPEEMQRILGEQLKKLKQGMEQSDH